MEAIIEIILNNSTWILTIITVVLLAIAGYFADKTEFGQRKPKLIKIPKAKPIKVEETPATLVVDEDEINKKIQEELKEKKPLTIDELTDENFEEGFNQFMPKKSLFDDSLLSSIDSLTFDEQKKASKRLPKMEDIDLPKIESLSDDIEDVWKF